MPQFRDGECEVRRLWDEAVAEAMGWDAAELSRLRHLLHQEPHVRGLGYGQYADEAEPADTERLNELADQWEREEKPFLAQSPSPSRQEGDGARWQGANTDQTYARRYGTSVKGNLINSQ